MKNDPMKRNFKIIVICVTVALVFVALFGVMIRGAESDYQAALEALESKGIAIRLSDLPDQYPGDIEYFDGPLEESTLAFQLSVEGGNGIDIRETWAWYKATLKTPGGVAEIDSTAEAAARNAVDSNQDIIARLKTLARQDLTNPKDIIVLSGMDKSMSLAKLPNLFASQAFANLLTWDAYFRYTDGDFGGAVEAIESIILLGEHISIQPTLINVMIGVAIKAIPLDLYGQIIIDDSVPHELKRRFLDTLRSHHLHEFYTISMNAELLGILQYFGTDGASILDIYSDDVNRGGDGGGFISSFPPVQYVSYKNKEFYAGILGEVIEASKLPYTEGIEQARRTQERIENEAWKGALTQLVLPNLSRSRHAVVAVDYRIYQLEIALAVSLFRAERGAYPDSIDALVPDFLEEIPQNDFENRPMTFVYVSADAKWEYHEYRGDQFRLHRFKLVGDKSEELLRVY